MNLIIETERLILRPILESDVDGMFELDANPEVHKYLGNKPITTKAQAADVIQVIRSQYQKNGIGRFAVVLKETNDFIGWAGLKLETNTINNHQNYYDLGYRLQQNYWGKGYATESAKAWLNYGLNTLQLQKICAAASCDNTASNKILSKIGMTFIESFYYENIYCNWYQIDRKRLNSSA